MSDNKSALDRVLERIEDPWDWAAVALGGAAGITASLFLHGMDFGHAAPSGALAAVGLRHAFLASRKNSRINRKADALEKYLTLQELTDLKELLLAVRQKWTDDILSAGEFEKLLDQISNEDTRRKAKGVLTPRVMPLALTGNNRKPSHKSSSHPGHPHSTGDDDGEALDREENDSDETSG